MNAALKSLVWLAAIVAASAIAFMLGGYATDVYRKMLIWVALALSYNFLFGISGQVAFSQLVTVVINEGGDLTGGTGGIASYRLPDLFGIHIRGPYYTILLVLMVAFTLWVLKKLDASAFGRACRAVRDNATAAAAMGVDVRRTKVIAFTLTSTLAGLAGISYAYIDNVINPPVFGLENAFLLLFMIIVGGQGRMAGAIVGAVLLYLAPFVLEPIVGHGFMVVFGLLVVLAILFQPAGLVGLFARWPARRTA